MLQTLKRVLAGNLISQLAGLALLPTLSLAYSAEDLGYYGVYFSLSAIASNFISLRIENVIFSTPSDSARSLERVALAVTTCTVAFFCIVGFLVTARYGGRGLWFVSLLGAAGIALFNVVCCVAIRLERTNAHVKAKVTRSFVELGLVVACVFLKVSITTLVWLLPLSYLFGFLVMMDKGCSTIRSDLRQGFALLMARRLDIKYDLIASIFNSGALYAPTIFFFVRSNAEVSGLFFAVTRYLGAPALMIAQGIGTTLKQHASAEYEKTGKCGNSVSYILKKVILKPMLAYAFLITGAVICAWFLEEFQRVNVFVLTCILVPLFFVRYVFNCVSSIVYVLSLQKVNMKFQAALFFLAALGLFAANKPIHSIFLYSALSISVYSCFLVFIVKKAKSGVNG